MRQSLGTDGIESRQRQMRQIKNQIKEKQREMMSSQSRCLRERRDEDGDGCKHSAVHVPLL